MGRMLLHAELVLECVQGLCAQDCLQGPPEDAVKIDVYLIMTDFLCLCICWVRWSYRWWRNTEGRTYCSAKIGAARGTV